MSTNINITVGNDALLDSSKQQQIANRQGQLEKESRKELKDRALAANADLRAALGKDLNGQPIYGVQLPIPEIDRRPAAAVNANFRDVFGYFYIDSRYSEEENSYGFYIRSGDGSQSAFSSYPAVADFGDLLLPYVSGGQLLGSIDYSPGGGFRQLHYDYLGRLLGSVGGIDEDYSSFANVWTPDYATYWNDEAGFRGLNLLQANYDSAGYGFYQVFPAGRDAAIVCTASHQIKLATTRFIRSEKDVQGPFEEPTGLYKCTYESSPSSYKEFRFYETSAEKFSAFYVSNTTVRYLGTAPSEWVSKVKNLSIYRTPSDTRNYVYTLRSIFTYTSWLNGERLPPACPAGVDQPTYPNYEYGRYFSGPNLGILYNSTQQKYKYMFNTGGIGLSATPAAFNVLNNFEEFVNSASSPITDTFVKTYVPAFAGDNLPWRYSHPNENSTAFTPYVYTGTPPVSWSSSPANEILANFPVDWKPSGKTVTNLNDENTVSVWDWNRPDYCRQQLLALGFTSADLTP